MLEKEIWKEWVFEKTGKTYEISNLGNARSKNPITKKVEYHTYSNNGYRAIAYQGPDGSKGLIYLHKIVLKLFVPNPDNLEKFKFLSSNTKDCSAANLKWITKEEDSLIRRNNVINSSRERDWVPGAKMTESRVALIKKRIEDNVKDGIPKTKWTILARQFDITYQHLYAIRKGKIWANIKPLNAKKSLLEEMTEKIKNL